MAEKSYFLDKEDIYQIRQGKRPGTILTLLSLLIGLLFVLAYSFRENPFPPVWIAMMGIAAVCIAAAVYFSINIVQIRDLRDGYKVVRMGTVQVKEHTIDYETGSGVLYIPILGDLFPKLWGQKMNPYDAYSVVVEGVRYKISKELYDAVEQGGEIEMHYARRSGRLLNLRKPRTA